MNKPDIKYHLILSFDVYYISVKATTFFCEFLIQCSTCSEQNFYTLAICCNFPITTYTATICILMSPFLIAMMNKNNLEKEKYKKEINDY